MGDAHYPTSGQTSYARGNICANSPVLTYLRLPGQSSTSSVDPGRRLCVQSNRGVIASFIANLSFGDGAVNQTNVHVFIDTMPLGGIGESSLGCANGNSASRHITLRDRVSAAAVRASTDDWARSPHDI
jgi:hypothetical protein